MTWPRRRSSGILPGRYRPGGLAGWVCATWLLFSPVVHGRQQTIADRWIPFGEMTVTNRAQIRAVTDHYTLRRAYRPRQFKGRQDQFEFLMDHVDACSVLAQALRLIVYRATRTADGRIYADNREGATGYLSNALATEGKRVYYIEGAQEGLFTARGRGVAVVDYRQNSADTIEYTGSVFVKVDNVVLAAFAWLFGAFLQGTVDRNFEQVMRNPVLLSEKALAEPSVLGEAVRKMPAEDRQLLDPFVQLLAISSNAAPPVSTPP